MEYHHFYMALQTGTLQSVEEWTDFFKSLRISNDEAADYATAFNNAGATEMSLQGLVNNATGLQTLGITKIGHVYSILGHINSLLSSSSLAASQAASTEAGSSSSQLSNNVPKPKLPALRQPKVCTSMTKQAFRKFEFDWNMLKLHSTIPENQCAMHLYNCCVDDVQSTITATYPNFLTMDEKAVIDMLRNLVTQSSNPLVHRMSFAKISQLPSESIQHFISRF